MSKKDKETAKQVEQEETEIVDNAPETEETQLSETELLQKELEETKDQLEKEKKEYMFLMAEFDNFRKRTLKEKAEIIKTATERAMKDILPVIDDFERGLAAMKESNDAEALREGIEIIYNKFIKYLEQNGVKEIQSTDADFDTEYHEAIAMVPLGDEEKKGKVIDTVAKGYTLNDKVIRHAKVAVAE
ncbi:MAG: nucleotide exchange factor GrpE [Muribaculaceae bacterium]|nr:nucleotide exchange factor GrpE [Muribaculaceae bacterium]